MTTDINKLFADICKRGCIIKTSTKYEYATKDLPKCLILADENIIPFDFMIKSIIPHDNSVIFRENTRDSFRFTTQTYVAGFNDMVYNQILDFSTYYVYGGNESDLFKVQYKQQLFLNIPPVFEINMSNYKQILKNKMIENLTELYLIKFMYLTGDTLSLPEIKIVIIETLFKLDKWNNLEI